jgi:hypothetical protein
MALLFGASSAFGLISRTIGPGKNFTGFDSACLWLKGQTQPLVDNYEFVVDAGTYAAAGNLDSINSGSRTITFRAATAGVYLTPSSGAAFAFYVRKTANVTLSHLILRKSGANDTAAICFRSSANGHVQACSVSTTGGGSYGIWADSSPDLRIDTCGIYNTGNNGIYLLNSLRGRLKACRVNIAGSSYALTGSDSTLIDSCSSVGNCSRGFNIDHCSDVRVRLCSLASTPSIGFYLLGSSRIKVDSCVVQGGDNQWFYLDSCRGCRIFRCRLGGSLSAATSPVFISNNCHYDSLLSCYIYVACWVAVRSTPSGAMDTANVFANNLIYEWGNTSGSTAWGFNLARQYHPQIYYNTIYGPNTDSLIRRYGMEITNCSIPKVKNNLIWVRGKDSATLASPCLYLSSTTLNGDDVNYNDLFAPAGSVAYYNGTRYTTLPAWRAVVGCDTNSIAADPWFPGSYNFSLTDSSPCRRAGTPIPGIPSDADGDPRHPTRPSIGCSEYIPPAPGAFALLTPGNGAQNQPVNIRLRWDLSTQADSYIVYLDRNSSPSTIVSRQTDTGYNCSGLLNDSTYYWRIEAKNWPSGLTGSGPRSFRTIIQAPAAFALRSPANSAVNQPVSGALVWHPSARADSYQVYFDTLNPPVTVAGWTTDTSFAYSGLKRFYFYYWKIVAHNFAGNTNSSQWMFQTIIDSPAVVILRQPADGDSNIATSGSLFWSAAARADSYIVYLDTLNPPVGVVGRKASPETSCVYTSLLNGKYYFWRIRAKNLGGITQSTVFSFRTPGVLPGAFNLLAPDDGDSNQLTDVRLRWQVSANTDTYLVYLDRNPSPTTVVSRRVDTGYTCAGLKHDSVYYWKVVAKRNPSGTYAAGPRSFHVSPVSPDTPFVPEPEPPLGDKHKGIKAGGCMAYLEVGTDVSTPMIFMLKGNGTYEFYRYNVRRPELGWTADAPIPMYNRMSKKKAPGKGATLTAAEGKVYAGKGNGVLDWWEFTPNPNGGLGTWVQKNDVPTGSKKAGDGAGAVSVNLSNQDYVYLLKGNGSMEFYRFNPSDNSWLTLSSAPGGPKGKGYKTGSTIIYYPDDKDVPGVNRHIYLLKGGYNEFYSFGVDNTLWTTLETLPRGNPKKVAKAGAGLAYHLDTIYTIKGNKTNEFWKYACTGAAWLRGPDVGGSGTIQVGGSIAYSEADNSLYIFKGGGTTSFYRYPLGVSKVSDPASLKTVCGTADCELRTAELRIWPNPMTSSLNPSITYSLPAPGNVSLKLYDVAGKLVSTLVSGYRPAGSYSYSLLTTHYSLASGVYLLKYESEGNTTTSKLIIE